MIDWNEIAHLPELAELAEILRRQLGIWVGILTSNGIVAYAGENQCLSNAICEAFMPKCRSSYVEWFVNVQEACAPIMLQCRAKLRGMAAPIMLNDKCIAAIFASGFIFDEDENDLFDGCRNAGFSPATLSNSIKQAQRLTHREANLALELMAAVARQIQTSIEPKADLPLATGFDNYAGTSYRAEDIRFQLQKAAESSRSILLCGGTGTGKTLCAQSIHQNSTRQNDAFLPISCVAANEQSFASELFGHKRGAFPGAICDMPGLLELAHGGTLLLEDIDALSPALQKRIVQLLQEKSYQPLGDPVTRSIDVRVLASTRMSASTFAANVDHALFYSLIPIELPSLAEHKDDIPAIAAHYLNSRGTHCTLTPELCACFQNYDWPGSVIELQSELDRLVMLQGHDVALSPQYVSQRIASPVAPVALTQPNGTTPETFDIPFTTLTQWMDDVERMRILQALEQNQFNRTRTAEALGVSRRNLIRKIERYGIDTPADDD